MLCEGRCAAQGWPKLAAAVLWKEHYMNCHAEPDGYVPGQPSRMDTSQDSHDAKATYLFFWVFVY